jgi:hypothetical protein
MNEELRAELLRRVAADQEARRTLDTGAMAAADGENPRWLRQLIADVGWPGSAGTVPGLPGDGRGLAAGRGRAPDRGQPAVRPGAHLPPDGLSEQARHYGDCAAESAVSSMAGGSVRAPGRRPRLIT